MTIICSVLGKRICQNTTEKAPQRPFNLGTLEGRKSLYKFVIDKTKEFKQKNNGKILNNILFDGETDKKEAVKIRCSYMANNLVLVEIIYLDGKKYGFINPLGKIFDKNRSEAEDWLTGSPKDEYLEK